MTNSTDVGIILVAMTVVFALASWFSVTVQRYWEQYGFKLFAALLVLYVAATAGAIVAANALLRDSDSMSPYWYVLCAGVGVVYVSIGAAIVSKPMPMLPAALHPSFVRVTLGATHGLMIEARGRKSPTAGAGFVTDDVRLYVDGDAFWTAMGTIVSSSLISMAQMTLLPVQLVPLYLPAGALRPATMDWSMTIGLGTKLNGQKGLGHATIRTNLAKLRQAGDPPIVFRFHTPPNQPLFTLELKPSQLEAAIAADADAQLNLWSGPAPAADPVVAGGGPQIDVKVPDAKLPDPSAPPAAAAAASAAAAAAPPATPSKQPLLFEPPSDHALFASSAPGLSAPPLMPVGSPGSMASAGGLPMIPLAPPPAHAFVVPPPNFDAAGPAVGPGADGSGSGSGNATSAANAPDLGRVESTVAPGAPGAM